MDLDLRPILDNLPFLLRGLWMNVVVSAVSLALSLMLGFAVGLGRSFGPRWLAIPLAFYVDSMRALPVLVVIVWPFFAFPLLAQTSIRPVPAAIAAFALHVAASVAEVGRAGVESVREGQSRAAPGLGMSRPQVLADIVLPQAVIRMLPAFASIAVITIKDSAVASVIAVPEIIRQSETVAGQTFRPFEVYTFALLAFVAILFPVARLIDRLYGRIAHLGRS